MLKFCSLSSSSSGNCLYVTDGSSSILIDCGLSFTKTSSLLNLIGVNISDIDAVLVTHEHTDHTSGLGVLFKKTGVPIYGLKETVAYVLYKYPYISNINLLPPALKIGKLEIKSFATSHDVPSVGYTIECGNKKISIATDLGIVTDGVCDALKGTDFAFIESNHDPEMLMYGTYPYHLKKRVASERGHLSNKMCSQLVCKLASEGTKEFMLGHISKENNTEDLALSTTSSALSLIGKSAEVHIAPKESPSKIIQL